MRLSKAVREIGSVVYVTAVTWMVSGKVKSAEDRRKPGAKKSCWYCDIDDLRAYANRSNRRGKSKNKKATIENNPLVHRQNGIIQRLEILEKKSIITPTDNKVIQRLEALEKKLDTISKENKSLKAKMSNLEAENIELKKDIKKLEGMQEYTLEEVKESKEADVEKIIYAEGKLDKYDIPEWMYSLDNPLEVVDTFRFKRNKKCIVDFSQYRIEMVDRSIVKLGKGIWQKREENKWELTDELPDFKDYVMVLLHHKLERQHDLTPEEKEIVARQQEAIGEELQENKPHTHYEKEDDEDNDEPLFDKVHIAEGENHYDYEL